MAPQLTFDGGLALAITGLALLLFLSDRYRADIVALVIMLALIVTGVLTPQQGISGFAHEATVTVALMLVLAAGLQRTGAIAILARRIGRVAGNSPLRLFATMLAVVLPLSAVINNTAAVAVLLPVMIGLARRVNASPSQLLMPLSFASQLGGTLTLIGTSTNLLVAGLALELGAGRIQLFDITPPALLVAAVGVLYLLTIGRWLLPQRAAEEDVLQRYELHDYLAVLRVRAGSPLVGRSLAEARFASTHRLQVVFIERDDEQIAAPTGATVLHAGDRLLVEGKIAELASVQDAAAGVEVVDAELTSAFAAGTDPEGAHFAEVLVPPRSAAVHATVRQLGLRARFGISAIAVRRNERALHGPIGNEPLQPGDMLLVRGTSAALNRLHEESALVLLGAVSLPRVRRHRMRLAVGIVAGVVLLPALGVTTILVSALLGVVAMLLTRCIRPDEVYQDIDWMVIVLIGAILPLGEAMHRTGAAAWLAHGLLHVASPAGPHGLLAAVIVLTSVLTAIISNAATAVVLTPIAVAVAASLGVSPLPFVIGVMIGASNSFLSPAGYQTNAMIYGPGGYRVADYVRVGGPLSLLVAITATVAIPLFFPF